MNVGASLHFVDYIVLAVILLVSLGIGLVFAVKDFRNVNRVQYLLGGRTMSMLPVALSAFATSMSAAGILGNAAEFYLYGGMPNIFLVGCSFGCFLVAVSLVPLVHQLGVSSFYQYLEMRFHSRPVRMFVVVVAMIQTIIYMVVVVLSPALALQAGVQIPLWISIGIVGCIGIIYTTIGGIKGVIWADAFQCLVMFAGYLIFIIRGVSIVGGGATVMNLARVGGRMSLTEISLDPRVRSTWWGMTFGSMAYGYSALCNQQYVQRVIAIKSKKEAQRAFILFGVLLLLCCCLLYVMSVLVFAFFALKRCDPLKAGFISSPNQLSPYFVVHALGDWPGFGGVYLATLFSGGLSTLSSGITSLASNTVDDLLARPLQSLKENTITRITKLLVAFFGLLVIAMAFWASTLPGSLVQTTIAAGGASAGPIMGLFLLGALFPQGNKYGALAGGVVGLIFNVWIALGNIFYGRRLKPLPGPVSDMCFSNISTTTMSSKNTTYMFKHTKSSSFNNGSVFVDFHNNRSSVVVKTDQNQFGFFLYDISFFWYSLTGAAVCLVVGLAVSCLTRSCPRPAPDNQLLFPCVRNLWTPKPKVKNHNCTNKELSSLVSLS